MSDGLDTAVCLFIFNRPSMTNEVFKQIASVQPKRLYVVADGPRDCVQSDPEDCSQAREMTESVEWECEVHRNYADTNLGIKQRFVTGLEWLFDHESEAIILEEDCVPNEDFFTFCETMLERYRTDDRIWDITGTNYLQEWKTDHQSYHFSFIGGIWGWATWRRSWEQYNPDMERWANPEVRMRLRDVLADDSLFRYAEAIYDRTYSGQIHTWDYPWGFTRQINSGLSVVPARNLVSNIGFTEDATNTTDDGPLANLDHQSLDFPLKEPPCVAVDREYDLAYLRTRTSFWERIGPIRWLTNKLVMAAWNRRNGRKK